MRTGDAERLVELATRGEIALHIPTLCLREAAASLRRKVDQRVPRAVRAYRRYALDEGTLATADADAVARFLDAYDAAIEAALGEIEPRITALETTPGVDVFPVGEETLRRVLRWRVEVPELAELKPFDEVILAGVIGRAEQLAPGELVFCELDADLLPWHPKDAKRERPGLATLYRSAGFVGSNGAVTVRSDFRLE